MECMLCLMKLFTGPVQVQVYQQEKLTIQQQEGKMYIGDTCSKLYVVGGQRKVLCSHSSY